MGKYVDLVEETLTEMESAFAGLEVGDKIYVTKKKKNATITNIRKLSLDVEYEDGKKGSVNVTGKFEKLDEGFVNDIMKKLRLPSNWNTSMRNEEPNGSTTITYYNSDQGEPEYSDGFTLNTNPNEGGSVDVTSNIGGDFVQKSFDKMKDAVDYIKKKLVK